MCPKLSLKISEDFALPLGGEDFLVGKKKKTWSESPSFNDIRGREVTVDRAFPVFTEFLRTIDFDPDADLLERLGGYVDLRLAQLDDELTTLLDKNPKAKKESLLRNEPVFIMALKKFLELRTDEWVRRV